MLLAYLHFHHASFKKIHALLHAISQSQALPNIRFNPLLKVRSSFSPHPSSVDIRGTLIVRLSDHAHDADQDLLHALNRAPALRSLLVMVGVVAGRVQD
jgi:hypothetical protein